MGVMMKMSRTYLRGSFLRGTPAAAPGHVIAARGIRYVADVVRHAGMCALGLLALAALGTAERACIAAESANAWQNTSPGIKMPSLHAQPTGVSSGIRDPHGSQAYAKAPPTQFDSRESRGLFIKTEEKPFFSRQAARPAPTKPGKAGATSAQPDRRPQAPRGELVSLDEQKPLQYGYVPVGGVAASLLNPAHAEAQASVVAEEPTSGHGYVAVAGVQASLISPARPEPREPAGPQQTRRPAPSDPVVWNGLSTSNRAVQKAMSELATQKPPQWPGQPTVTTNADTPPAPTGQTLESIIDELNAQRAVALSERRPPSAQGAAANETPAGAQEFSLKEPPTLEARLMSATPGLTLWTETSPANLAALMAVSQPQGPAPVPVVAKPAPKADTPWSLGEDLDKYRAHAVREGSRDSGESLKKALKRAGLALEDGANIFVLGYGSDRAKPFRVNDGKGLLDEPGKVPQQAGATLGTFGAGLYSVADLVTLNALPDPNGDAYQKNHPLVRPLIYTGQTIGGVWKTTEEVGNAVTWGYFDNVTGCIGLCLESIIELLKHTGEAVTNLARAPIHLIAGKDNEGANQLMDWVLVVPLEFASNSVQMKGIANMQEYETAFADKGVIGSVLEFGGSTFLIYRTVDELLDELDDDHRSRRANSEPGEPEPEVPTPEPVIPKDIEFYWGGEWPTGMNPLWQGGA